jgi:hypothetical protein
MIRLATVIDTFEADFLAQYRDQLTPDHYRALAAMKHCRTQTSPMMQVKCTACEHQKLVPHSCGHRHCPHCQHHESQQWLERQMKKQVPAEYFLLTFTLPAEFRTLAFAHQNVVYDLLMRCSWETVRTFSQNDKQLQGRRVPLRCCTRTRAGWIITRMSISSCRRRRLVDGKQKRWRTKSPRGKAKDRAICSTTRRWPRSSGRRCWRRSAAGLTLPGALSRRPGWWIASRSVQRERRR